LADIDRDAGYAIEIGWKLQVGSCPVAVSLLQYSTQTHVSHTHITQNNTTKNKQKQISSQSHTNSEGHITANEHSVEKGKDIKRSLIQALEPY
jgi:hypothetical protein